MARQLLGYRQLGRFRRRPNWWSASASARSQIDPDYSKAWGLLAIAQCILHFVHARKDGDGLEAAERALELDQNLAEAHIVESKAFA